MFEIEGQYFAAEQARGGSPSPRARKRRADQSSAVGQKTLAEQARGRMPVALGTNRPEEGHIEYAEQGTERSPLPVDTHQAAEGQLPCAEKANDSSPSPLDAIIKELIALQKQRRFINKAKSQIDRSMEAYLAQLAGYRPKTNPDGTRITDADGKPVQDKAGKALWAEIGRVRKAVEARNPINLPAWADVPMILASSQSRASWDAMLRDVEKRMEDLAKLLPVWPWWQQIRGAGAKGLAIIVGEAGDVGSYRSKSHLWKRLGLAVIDGGRQRRVKGDAAIRHGYVAPRRAEIWTLAESLIKHQRAGDKDEDGADPKKSGKPVAGPAHPTGPYGEHYTRRKEYVSKRERGLNSREPWDAKHIDNDAKRYMTKALIRDLRAAWRQADTVTQ